MSIHSHHISALSGASKTRNKYNPHNTKREAIHLGAPIFFDMTLNPIIEQKKPIAMEHLYLRTD